MKIHNEQKDFCSRLRLALQNADYPSDSPTRFAQDFNLRFDGRPVTVHAARKWLVGEAIPTQEKLRTLSTWLGVSAVWLRYGDVNPDAGPGERPPAPEFMPETVRMMADIDLLDEHHRRIAVEFIQALLRVGARRR
jgi:hypothetical protein